MKKHQKNLGFSLINLIFLISVVVLGITIFRSFQKSSGETVTKLHLREHGFSMHIPKGWKINDNEFFDPKNDVDNWGNVIKQPLHGKTLEQYVNKRMAFDDEMVKIGQQMTNMTDADKIKTVSKSSKKISGLESIQITRKDLDFMMEIVWIRKGDEVIIVRFQILLRDYPQHKSDFQDSISSIQIH